MHLTRPAHHDFSHPETERLVQGLPIPLDQNTNFPQSRAKNLQLGTSAIMILGYRETSDLDKLLIKSFELATFRCRVIYLKVQPSGLDLPQS